MPQTTDQWLLEAVRYFRQLGFFEHYAQSDDELAEIEERRLQEEWGDDWDPLVEHPDLFLLAHDSRRVWWMDMEADVFPGNNAYVRSLSEWGAISRGAFQPEKIREEWKGEKGPIFLDLTHMGRTYRISPKYWGDYLDIEILSELNRIIRDTGIQFEPYENFDQTCFIVALTAEEKRRLRVERKWQFAF